MHLALPSSSWTSPFSGLDPVVRDELIQTLLGRIHLDDSGADESGATILISSHDLGEIESFATHVAFLHEGTLLFAEPMNTLITRFREVTVTLPRSESAEEYMTNLPDSWLSPESSGAVIRFIYTKADTEPPEIAVRGVFQWSGEHSNPNQ